MKKFCTLPIQPKLQSGIILLALIMAIGVQGCATAHKVQVSHDGIPLYKKLELNCQFRRELNYDAILPAQQDIRQTAGLAEHAANSGDGLKTTGQQSWNRGFVEIVCPHPNGKPDQALVRLKYWKEDQPLIEAVRTSSVGGLSSFTSQIKQVVFQEPAAKETSWLGKEYSPEQTTLYTRELVVPRYKIDFLLSDLANSGFYQSQTRPVGAALVSLKIDEGHIEKRWDLEPRLRELISETLQYHEKQEIQEQKGTGSQTDISETDSLLPMASEETSEPESENPFATTIKN